MKVYVVYKWMHYSPIEEIFYSKKDAEDFIKRKNTKQSKSHRMIKCKEIK